MERPAELSHTVSLGAKFPALPKDWSVSTLVNALSYLFAATLNRCACEKARALRAVGWFISARLGYGIECFP